MIDEIDDDDTIAAILLKYVSEWSMRGANLGTTPACCGRRDCCGPDSGRIKGSVSEDLEKLLSVSRSSMSPSAIPSLRFRQLANSSDASGASSMILLVSSYGQDMIAHYLTAIHERRGREVCSDASRAYGMRTSTMAFYGSAGTRCINVSAMQDM